jgi:hypothetical protein
MQPIEDADIESSRTEHFPRRLDNGHSKTVCAYICLILSHKAQHETAGGWSKKLRLVLRKFGVPENQFHRVKSVQLHMKTPTHGANMSSPRMRRPLTIVR